MRKLFWIFSKRINGSFRIRLTDNSGDTVIYEVCSIRPTPHTLSVLRKILLERLQWDFERIDVMTGWRRAEEFPRNPIEIYSPRVMPVSFIRDGVSGRWVPTNATVTDVY
jgi:hypothetical protein